MRLLQHLREIEEPFEEEQIGSSAMAYKRNPMRAERIDALARHLIVNSLNPAFTAATQWFERTLDDSANRRIAIPEAFLAADAIALIYDNIVGGIVVHEDVIAANVRRELPFLMTENLMMEGVRARRRPAGAARARPHPLAGGRRRAEGRRGAERPLRPHRRTTRSSASTAHPSRAGPAGGLHGSLAAADGALPRSRTSIRSSQANASDREKLGRCAFEAGARRRVVGAARLVVRLRHDCAAAAGARRGAARVASWYGEEFAGRTTANGEIFDPLLLTAAHRTLPFGTVLDVTNPKTADRRVRINDRGPFIGGRVIDLSYAAAQQIGLIEPGIGEVDMSS